MSVSRRRFLTYTGAGVVAAAIDAGGLLSPALLSPAFAAGPAAPAPADPAAVPVPPPVGPGNLPGPITGWALSPVTNSGVTDKLFVIFCHHTIESISNTTGDIDPFGSNYVYAQQIEWLLLRYPNVILVVNGHKHSNGITPHARASTTGLGNNVPGVGGFWEVNTASHIDFPSQSRIIEIAAGTDTILTQSRAETVLSSVGLDVNVDENFDCVDPGTVIAQSPAVGATVEKGSTVTITVTQPTNHSGKPCVDK